MSNISYLHCDPGIGGNPEGKPRVYFCCHPNDVSVYYDEIISDIRKVQDVAVYYPEPDQIPEISELEQMQLFVVPVTSNFLLRDNHALQVEFPYAVEHHIPILPLLQERELVDLFNEKCGDMQCLDKYDTDPTAIPYAEKLKRYLDMVLLDDKLTKQVQAAFDTSIFISYRKKDRAYAQQLMGLIHQNPLCWDIAIWYDEFLIPGEKFNMAIQDKLDKADLFTLVVTPNLLEEGNYVMTEEYPAVRGRKPILPVEMIKTDQKELEEKYQGIPSVIPGLDSARLGEILQSQIKRAAVSEDSSSPQHLFFMGLAYLGGISVEVDRAHAIRLLTRAAEQNLPEAIKKLVDMYNSGDGVTRNYYTAIAWQRKLAAQYQKQFLNVGNKKNFLALFCALRDLGEMLFQAKKPEEAAVYFKQMLNLYLQCYKAEAPSWLKKNIILTYGRVGNVTLELGDISGAKAYYEKGLMLSEELMEGAETTEANYYMAVSCNNLGDIALKLGDLSGAKAYYERAMALNLEWMGEAETIDSKRSMVASYDKLGNAASKQGDLSGAKSYYEKCRELAQNLMEEKGTTEFKRILAIIYNKLGDTALKMGDLSGAKAFYEKALRLNQELMEETETVDAKHNMMMSYYNFGNLAMEMEDLSGAKAYYEKSLALSQELMEETGTRNSKIDLAARCGKLGDVALKLRDVSGALEYYEKAVKFNQEPGEKPGRIELKNIMWFRCIKLGEAASKQGDLSGAKEYFKKGLELGRELMEETGTIESRRYTWSSCHMIGDTELKLGNVSSAKMYYEKGVALSQKLMEETGRADAMDDHALSLYKLYTVSHDDDHILQAYKIIYPLVTQYPLNKRYAEHAKMILQIALQGRSF